MKRIAMRPLPNIECLKIDTAENNDVSHVNKNSHIRLVFLYVAGNAPQVPYQCLKLHKTPKHGRNDLEMPSAVPYGFLFWKHRMVWPSNVSKLFRLVLQLFRRISFGLWPVQVAKRSWVAQMAIKHLINHY
jgi:hypothetical protein